MVRALAEHRERVKDGNRHDAMRDTLMALIRLGEQGHAGADAAIDQLREQFQDDIGDDRPGVTAEFERAARPHEPRF